MCAIGDRLNAGIVGDNPNANAGGLGGVNTEGLRRKLTASCVLP